MPEQYQHHRIRLILGYSVALLLVPLYTNMYVAYRLLSDLLGKTVMGLLPVAVTALALGAVYRLYRGRIEGGAGKGMVSAKYLLWGSGLCLIALCVPDPQFPVKRIHVAEYMALALVVRYAMSTKLNGHVLLVCSALFASLLGIHDEFLQGIHPLRTYGLRDMVVNSLGAWGGAFIWHGLALFNCKGNGRCNQNKGNIRTLPPYLFWLMFSVFALVYPFFFYRNLDSLPIWPILPMAAAMVIFAMYENQFDSSVRHGMLALSLVSFSLGLYPVLINAATISFY